MRRIKKKCFFKFYTLIVSRNLELKMGFERLNLGQDSDLTPHQISKSKGKNRNNFLNHFIPSHPGRDKIEIAHN